MGIHGTHLSTPHKSEQIPAHCATDVLALQGSKQQMFTSSSRQTDRVWTNTRQQELATVSNQKCTEESRSIQRELKTMMLLLLLSAYPKTHNTLQCNSQKRRNQLVCWATERWKISPFSPRGCNTHIYNPFSMCCLWVCSAPPPLPSLDHVPVGTRPFHRDPHVHAWFQGCPFKVTFYKTPTQKNP